MITPLDILSIETWTLLISIIVLIRWYIHRKWQVLSNLNIPHSPPSILGLGNLGDLFKDPDRFYKNDLEYKKKFGLVYGSYAWLAPRIVIADPEVLKLVYIKEAGVFRDRQRNFSKLNGKDLNTMMTVATGDQWKRIRNTVSPTFSSSKLKDMFSIVEECTDKMNERFFEICKEKNGRFNSKDLFGDLSMEVICSSAFGVNAHTQDGESELVQRSKELFAQRIFGPVTFLVMLFPWFETVLEKFDYTFFKRDSIAYYKRLVDAVIKNKKEASGKVRQDILYGLLSNEISEQEAKSGAVKGLTRREILGNSILMLLAGYDTTTNTIIFLAYSIAADKDVQEKVYEEIVETQKKYEGKLSYEAVNSMKYLDMCMKESQRIYGAVPRNSRYTDVEITLKGITIPAGTHVDVPVYGLHHDEEYWEDPWKFVPERFEDMSKIDPMIFQPFGAGPRNCIGMRLAIIEVKMAVAKLLSKFELSLCEDTPKPPLEMMFRASMQPKEDIFLQVSPRQNQED